MKGDMHGSALPMSAFTVILNLYAFATDRVDLEVKGGVGRITIEQSTR